MRNWSLFRRHGAHLGATLLSLALLASPARADAAVLGACAQTAAGFDLVCTANDVRIATVTEVVVLDDGCTAPGDAVTFSGTAELVSTASERYDIGLYFAHDGGDALTGQCLRDILPTAPPPFASFDGDACGDIGTSNSPAFVPFTSLTVQCVDSDLDGTLDLRACLTWAQGKNDFCGSVTDAIAGSPSKCNCETIPITEIPVPPGAVEVSKTASPTQLAEPGDTATFTVAVFNPSPVSVTLTTLTDNVYGDLNGNGTCSVPHAIAAGGTYTCSFTGSVSGGGGSSQTDVVTAVVTDPSNDQFTGSDDATVTIVDVPSSIVVTKDASPSTVDPGGFVTFSVSVQNTSVTDTVTIDSLLDSVYGNLDGVGTCAVPQTLAPGATYACSFGLFLVALPGTVHTNVVTASGTDDDGQPVSDDDPATVNVTYGTAAIEVTKTATPGSLDEPGGPVTFSVTVGNLSAFASVNLTSLVDSVHGNLAGKGTCSVPQMIGPGGSYSCSFVANVTGNAGYVELDVVTATGIDSNGGTVTDDDSATVTIVDVPSSIAVTKLASPDALPEPGGPVTFSVAVANTSAVDSVTIATLIDSIHGNLNGQGTCAVPQTIAPGGTYTCSFTANVAGTCDDIETDVVTASGSDDDGTPVSDDDDAKVVVTDLPASIRVTKDATPSSILEPGGTVTFAVTIDNASAFDAVAIDSLLDTVYGNLNGQGSCAVPQTIPAGGSYSCSFQALVAGNAGSDHTNVVTASGTDGCGLAVVDDDAATVTISNVPSQIEVTKLATPDAVNEPGGAVAFDFTITNVSPVDSVTITTLTDTVYGDLDGRGTCSVPQTLAVGASYSCSFTANVTGNAGDTEINVVTATGTDDDGEPVSDSDSETVTLLDVPSAMTVIKSATPSIVDEPGALVTFDVQVFNQSTADTITVGSLVDSVHGDLNGRGTCSVPQTVPPGTSYACSFQASVTGPGNYTETDVVTADASDDDGNPLTADDDATVLVQDVAGTIAVTKTANPAVTDPGTPVTFTVSVENTSQFDVVTIDALTDSVYGDVTDGANPLLDATTCSVPQTLAVGATYTCSFSTTFTDFGSETDLVTAAGTDDDGVPVSGSDDAHVQVVGCGDGIVQDDRGETCDDGNHSLGDGCSPTCQVEEPTEAICTHTCASKIAFTPGARPDKLVLRVGWIPSDPNLNPPDEPFGVLLANQHGIIWQGVLQPGDFVKSGRRWLYKDRTGTRRNGITQAVITYKPDGVWRLDLRVSADMSLATESLMATVVLSGNETFLITSPWTQLAHGWRVFQSQ